MANQSSTEGIRIAIVGAGPGGLSAALRAAELGISHVLIEAAPNIANTIRRYQKGKLVMSEPRQLPLRSSLSFTSGIREDLLRTWQQELADRDINLLTGDPVTNIQRQHDGFLISLSSGHHLTTECVVLAIGLQGNVRKLGVPGETLPNVQYQLDDPDEYRSETIAVIGGGDAGVENALALTGHNRVILLNRQEEFTTCSEANFQRLRDAIKAGGIETQVNTSVVRVEAITGSDAPLSLVVQSPQGMERIECHRIIARLGATPPRRMLEGFGIRFPSDDRAAVPQLSERYESNVPGLYIIGALAGYPLIKQALNQGYEVIEYIQGNPVEPADQGLLLAKFLRIPDLPTVTEGIDLLRANLPLFAPLTTLQLREFMLDSEVLTPPSGEVIFRRNDYGNSFFSLLRGAVEIHIEGQDGKKVIIKLAQGDFFGEIGLLSGRRRSATVVAGNECVLVETPRRSMLKLLDAVPGVQRKLDEVALRRVIRGCLGASLAESEVAHLVQAAKSRQFAVGEVIFNEGDESDALYMIRKGSVTVSRKSNDKEVVAAYISAGNYFGEMGLISKTPRTATVRAAAPTEVILLEAERFNAVLDQNPSVRREVTSRYLEGVRSKEASTSGKNSGLIQFLMDQGVGEATDVLLIDYSKCIRCDNCETACAELHDGTSRFSRRAGQTYEQIHVPASCRHCEHPRCMKDCPPDAIHRSINGEVYITDACIGCGNCQSNCPYGVIQMAEKTQFQRPSLLHLIFGMKIKHLPQNPLASEGKKAVKCDMCRDIIGGSACVRACPTGAAFRVNPEDFLTMLDK
ncbi:MAG: cyclic nucleotide-binding domain-containing protein [Rhodocyclaceae bacterium]|nr:cyclic nucleotide-binding domain-containing protein [Rhodocyclaceae bacterium]MDZ4213674.1 cyclic nucleotide-binding domain-containing protein [Rhodocyclaceae bacterium]